MSAARLVLASNNAKKLAEMRRLLDGLALEAVAQGDLGVAEAEEPHHSFIENALAKARHAALHTGCAAVADDSGLCVPALVGEPGVASAHFAPWPRGLAQPPDREARRAAQDAANNALLLQRLHGVGDRRAYFACTLVALRHAGDPEPLVATARWWGRVLQAPVGQGGFGYDPLLHIDALGATVAQLPADVKNTHSHRALAMQQLHTLLREVWGA